jgi:hypothetical protein
MRGVGGEIHHDLVDLGRVREDQARIGGQVRFQGQRAWQQRL